MNIAYNVDCMEYMATLPDKAFDLAVVDPPYGDEILDLIMERKSTGTESEVCLTDTRR